jgi:hypothetical protein
MASENVVDFGFASGVAEAPGDMRWFRAGTQITIDSLFIWHLRLESLLKPHIQ